MENKVNSANTPPVLPNINEKNVFNPYKNILPNENRFGDESKIKRDEILGKNQSMEILTLSQISSLEDSKHSSMK